MCTVGGVVGRGVKIGVKSDIGAYCWEHLAKTKAKAIFTIYVPYDGAVRRFRRREHGDAYEIGRGCFGGSKSYILRNITAPTPLPKPYMVSAYIPPA